MRDMITSGLRFCAAAAILGMAAGAAFPAMAADEGAVVSFHGQKATAQDIVKGLASDDAEAGAVGLPALPPGMLPQGPIGEKRTRGITMTSPGAAAAARAGQDSGAVHAASTAPAPRPAAGAPGCNGSGRAVALDIRFALDSDKVDPSDYAELGNLADAMRDPSLAACDFVLEGHTDASGAPGYNMALSHRRAASVQEFLTALGIRSDRLTPIGKGDTELLDSRDPLSGVNRRVQIRIRTERGY